MLIIHKKLFHFNGLMKKIVLISLLSLSVTSYAQLVNIEGDLVKSNDDFVFAEGGIVISEPSQCWNLTSSHFTIKCFSTDTALHFFYEGKQFRYKISTAKNFYKIYYESSIDPNLSFINQKSNEFFLRIMGAGLCASFNEYFITNNKIIQLREDENTKGGRRYLIYEIDTAFEKVISQNIINIINNLPAEDYNSGDYIGNLGYSVDDGYEIILRITYENKYYKYSFQEYYDEGVDKLIENINTIVKDNHLKGYHGIPESYKSMKESFENHNSGKQ